MVSRTKATPSSAVWIFVEGGGPTRDEQAALRHGFSDLFAKVLGTRKKPSVIACGARGQAFREWQCALESHPHVLCLLLVDSEGPVAKGVDFWAYIQNRAGDAHWKKPAGVSDEQLHFMVQVMEAWFIADPAALARYYGTSFQPNALPARPDVENIPKQELAKSLAHASRNTTKGSYMKHHGFALIGLIDPAKVRAASPWAARFFDHLLAICPAR
ncbi:DUF4276 family protein [Polyangium sp. 15x6]|uniref:DUF4276 family protein n=1 Tax=Polyangium sp. 15x6 TaxID=3042687 RepID=UPI00249A5410|nr:DUF4276 family protein [Polyangium sp. 15x6]MDI3285346.1 DUF4276 family protein [Polyangium sp. 15x6]